MGAIVYFLWIFFRKNILYPSFNFIIIKSGLNNIFPNQISQNASSSLETNLEFKIELCKIIKVEGGIDDFIEKTKFIKEFDPYNIMVMGYKMFSEKSPENVSPKTAEVIDSIMKSNAIKETILKFNLSKNEIDTLANGLYIGIGDKNFKEIAIQIMDEVNTVA